MTTPQMDWLDDQRRKRAVSSDDIVRRMKLMDVPPGSYDEETLYDAVAEIKRLRAEIERLPAVARADDIVKQLEWLHSEFYDVDSVTSIVELAKAEIERLRAAIDALLTDIDGDHRPEWSSDDAEAAGKKPWCCAWCGAADGDWPCAHRRALDELKEARHGQ